MNAVRSIGVAIGIPEPFRTELRDWRKRLGDPNAGLIVPHVTLLGPTEVLPSELATIERHLAGVAVGHEPFVIRLQGSGTFRPLSPVVFVTLAQGTSCCELLEKAVRSGPLDRPTRFSYHPHVTVAHELDEVSLDRAFDLLAEYRASFEVTGFELYERGDDCAWRQLRHFPFAGGGGRPTWQDNEMR
ncbi:phosphoesterase [Frankia sp. CcI49]|uniref:2'-5' RNA ligase family protein n=1 Tax=Frankia sp. CcI49 TaxID=1745382 RepID=UPI000975FD0E|nr:2'-5' RNA ligase family protein [Frankia sp. CcI49]ONH59691.1 phosphoesterase [Frankia sp. CcI49]